MTKLTSKLTEVLKRESVLKAALDQYNDDAFFRQREAAFEKARKGNATDQDREAAEAAADGRLLRDFAGKRAALAMTLEAHLRESFAIFRDEFIVPTLESRKARREHLQRDVADLNQKYPGALIGFDHSYDEGPIDQLQRFAWMDVYEGYIDMESLVNFYA